MFYIPSAGSARSVAYANVFVQRNVGISWPKSIVWQGLDNRKHDGGIIKSKSRVSTCFH